MTLKITRFHEIDSPILSHATALSLSLQKSVPSVFCKLFLKV